MNSLVGYGLSSDSDSDGEAEDGGCASAASSAGQVGDDVRKTRNFLLEPDSASSESEPEDEDPEPSSSSSPPPSSSSSSPACQPPPSQSFPTASNKLPSPPLDARSDSSVFANPFKAQADQKLSALQKHVPLTVQARPTQIGGKRMCVSYRKDGRCRFGIKCKFAHDSDLQTPPVPGECRPAEGEETPAEAVGSSCGGGSQSSRREAREEESEGQQAKKRRVGLSNTLIPPKRAMKQYAMQRDRERINMS